MEHGTVAVRRKSQRQRQRDRDRNRDRDTETETETQGHTETERQRHRDTERQRDRESQRQRERQRETKGTDRPEGETGALVGERKKENREKVEGAGIGKRVGELGGKRGEVRGGYWGSRRE